ncbi:MAG: BON domain-containing protein [Alteromonas sp.]|jgi:osmotically-inducible protein OsmY|uniref:BON domain-containing protein n=1 Tax=Alteromonas australica TaxID=589873 RepID=UPI000C3D142C|nr:BON domain-containing protein [Alteromonas australica]MAO31315.1 BON domain-containing protein [Alteromonas sp.]|tara:strand:+ start:172 stop:756 length:585 start_codon:yes stop_codon:yes gene_type:complete
MKQKHSKLFGLIAALIVMTQLQGCVAAIGAAGAMAAKVANDRRTVGTQLDDQNANRAVAYQWAKSDELKARANLQVDVYNGVALLTGQAPTQALIDEAVKRAQDVSYIKKIHNQIRLGEPIGAGTQANDIWLASKVRTKIITDERVPALQIKVIVQDSEVFLMGRLSNLEATTAVDIARNVTGVARVVRTFEII